MNIPPYYYMEFDKVNYISNLEQNSIYEQK